MDEFCEALDAKMRKQTRRTKYSSPINFGDMFKSFQQPDKAHGALSHKAKRKEKKDKPKPKKLKRSVSKGLEAIRVHAPLKPSATKLSEETRSVSTVSIKSQLKEAKAITVPPISCTEKIEPSRETKRSNIEVSDPRHKEPKESIKKDRTYQSLSQGSQHLHPSQSSQPQYPSSQGSQLLFQTPEPLANCRNTQKKTAMVLDSEPDEGSRTDSISLLGMHEPNSLQQSEMDRREDYKMYRTYDSLSPVNPAMVKEIFDSMLRHFLPRIKYHSECRVAFERKYQLPACYEQLVANFKMIESAMYNLTALGKAVDYGSVKEYCWEVHKK
jgi:hypothetical protein